ncbi:MAG: putative DNA modification/repair radical SAM protein [Candidatus Woesearchaeota archaeon]|jgi:putative DNA modification/repair radical SAM protein
MEILEKVKILGASGKWDVCASSCSTRKVTTNDRIGDAASSGICHSFTENGRCISLFKTLLTNKCSYDCRYCQNSSHCKKQVANYEPEELAKVFMTLYVKNYVEGLFISSGIEKDANESTEKMIQAVELIRMKYKFQGYIHFKALPGADRNLIKHASTFADRISVNLEQPNKARMNEVSSVKDYKIDILRRQKWIQNLNLPSGQTTQLVVGGSDESDLEILRMVDWEYENVELNRAYYSAFTPIKATPFEFKNQTPYEREHRLYNVDFMMRKYDISLSEFRNILVDENLPKGDPKIHLARLRFNRPIDLNSASKEDILRVPGIGPQSAEKILSLQSKNIKIEKREQLASIGVVLKRAEPFIKINGIAQKTLGEFA